MTSPEFISREKFFIKGDPLNWLFNPSIYSNAIFSWIFILLFWLSLFNTTFFLQFSITSKVK
jgi:hypothetical protein